MISLKKSNNVFYNKRVILDYFDSNLFESDKELEEINWFELRIPGQNNEDIFGSFLERFFSLLKEDFSIDIVSYERTEKIKNRLRLYGKLFYDLRKENFINDKFLIEKELDTDNNKSIFTGIIQVDKIDNEIIFNEIFNNHFKFGHAELFDKNTIEYDRLERLIQHIDLKLLRKGKLIEVDYLILLQRFITLTSMVFSYLYDGKDDLVFKVYCGKIISDQIEEFIIESLPSDIELNRINASPQEVDRLIDSYLNSWRIVKN